MAKKLNVPNKFRNTIATLYNMYDARYPGEPTPNINNIDELRSDVKDLYEWAQDTYLYR
jgi:hypothetical protein